MRKDEYPKRPSSFSKVCDDTDSVFQISTAFRAPSAAPDNQKQK